jgi:hypothetical protein
MRESVPFDVRLSGLRAAFLAASIAWALLLAVAPWIAGAAAVTSASTAFVIAIYGIGSLVCHQLPARSFRLFAVQMPVCARCTGIYLGAAMAALVATTWRGARLDKAMRRIDPLHATNVADAADVAQRVSSADRAQRHLWAMLTAAAVPSALTVIAEWTTGVTPSNIVRCAAGLPLGAALAWAVVRDRHGDECGAPAGPRG